MERHDQGAAAGGGEKDYTMVATIQQPYDDYQAIPEQQEQVDEDEEEGQDEEEQPLSTSMEGPANLRKCIFLTLHHPTYR